MSEKNKIPEIRFKGFGGEWEFQTIDKLIKDGMLLPPKDGNHGNIHPKSTDYVDYGIPFIMANNIKKGKIDFYNCSHISKEQADSLQKGFAKEGDILLTHKGTVGEVAVVHKNEFPYLMLTPQVTYYRVIESERLCKNFLAFSFISDNFQHTLKEASGGGTRAYIGITKQQKLGVSIPSKPVEQTKIGTFFKNLDTLITLHQRKYDKLLKVKKAMLEKMFPKNGADVPEIRFKGFSDKWEERKITELAKIFIGLVTTMTKYYRSEGTLLIRNSDIKSNRFEFSDEPIYLDPKFADDNSNRKLQIGDVVTVHTGDVGTSAVISKNEENSIGFATIITRPKKELIESSYLSVYFNSDDHKRFAVNVSTGDGRTNYNLKDFYELMVPFSSITEQTKIGTFFKNLDTLLTLHQSKLEKLKNIKKACMEKMFV